MNRFFRNFNLINELMEVNSYSTYESKTLQTEEGYSIEINLPTFSKEEIDISYSREKNILTVSSDIKDYDIWKKSFKNRFAFSNNILLDASNIETSLADGILKIKIPIKKEKSEDFKILIK